MQLYFRMRMFFPEEKESDGHVVRYKWLAEQTTPVHPPFYFVHFCPECCFADTLEDFAHPTRNRFSGTVVKYFKGAEQEQKSVIELLGKHVRYPDIDFESALNLHLLAVYVQLLPPNDRRDVYKIGRLLLRVAWLFREHSPPKTGDQKDSCKDEGLEGMAAFETLLHDAQEGFRKVGRTLEERIAKIDQEIKDPDANPLRKHVTSLGILFDAQLAELHRLKTAAKLDTNGTSLEEAQRASKPFFSFPSYKEFLTELKEAWPPVPIDEFEAMRGAIAYFKQAVSTDPAFDDPQAYVSAILLVADLMIRCDLLDGAFNMVRVVYSSAAEARRKYQLELQKKELDAKTKRQLTGQIRRLTGSIERAGDLRRDLLDLLIERERPKIELVLKDSGRLPLKKLEQVLEQNGITPGMITRMKEQGGLLHGRSK